jgi:hypothetical protein
MPSVAVIDDVMHRHDHIMCDLTRIVAQERIPFFGALGFVLRIGAEIRTRVVLVYLSLLLAEGIARE